MLKRVRICELCELEVDKLEKHHLFPKSRVKGKLLDNTIKVCAACGGQIHALFDNKELERGFYSLSKLKKSFRMQRYLKWRKKHPKVRLKIRQMRRFR